MLSDSWCARFKYLHCPFSVCWPVGTVGRSKFYRVLQLSSLNEPHVVSSAFQIKSLPSLISQVSIGLHEVSPLAKKTKQTPIPKRVSCSLLAMFPEPWRCSGQSTTRPKLSGNSSRGLDSNALLLVVVFVRVARQTSDISQRVTDSSLT